MDMKYEELRKKIGANVRNMDAKTFFTAPQYQRYLERMARAVLTHCMRIAGKKWISQITIEILYEQNSNFTACTDSESFIQINTGYRLIRQGGSLENQFKLSLGVLLHEISHILFLDGEGWLRFFNQVLDTGKIPDLIFPEEELNDSYQSMKQRLSGDEGVRKIFMEYLKPIENILNDAIDEELIMNMLTGYYVDCLRLLRSAQYNNFMSMEEVLKYDGIEENMLKVLALRGQILLYAKYGTFKLGTLENLPAEMISDLDRIKDILDWLDKSNVTSEIQFAVISVMTVLWPYLKDALQAASAEDGGEEDASGSEERISEETVKRILEILTRSEENVAFHGTENGSLRGVLIGSEAICSQTPQNGSLGPSGGLNGQSAESILINLKRDIAESMTLEEAENEETQKLKRQCREISKQLRREDSYYAEIIKMERAPLPTPSDKHEYEQKIQTLRRVIYSCSRNLLSEIEEKKLTAKMTGQFTGRLDTRRLSRQDGQVFYRNRIPQDELDLCICVVMDESGSMSANGRVEALKNMAVIVDSFAQKLHIPCLMFGHTTCGERPLIYLYRDFETFGRRDSERLMRISARSSNMDGHVIEYAIKRLQERPESMKIMLVISDGLPHETVHMVDTIKKGRKSGIRIIGAAIGDDAESIKSLYGEQSFLNISDLQKLPQAIIRQIKQYIVL